MTRTLDTALIDCIVFKYFNLHTRVISLHQGYKTTNAFGLMVLAIFLFSATSALIFTFQKPILEKSDVK